MIVTVTDSIAITQPVQASRFVEIDDLDGSEPRVVESLSVDVDIVTIEVERVLLEEGSDLGAPGDGSSTPGATTEDCLSEFELQDVSSPIYYYYGGIDLSTGLWVVNRWSKASLIKESTNQTENSEHETLASAWSNRLSLSAWQ